MKSKFRGVLEHIYKTIKKKRILYIGVAEYSNDVKILEENNKVISIDKDMLKGKFGAKKHYCMSISGIVDFPDNYFDLVIMVGVHGYGLNNIEDLLKSFDNIKRILKYNGNLILTLNNNEHKKNNKD